MASLNMIWYEAAEIHEEAQLCEARQFATASLDEWEHRMDKCLIAVAVDRAKIVLRGSFVSTVLAIVGAMLLASCAVQERYRTEVFQLGKTQNCAFGASSDQVECATQSTERNSDYTMHVVEFDDQGWPYREGIARDAAAAPPSQIDSAIWQVDHELDDPNACVQLFVYIHGWNHNAESTDNNVGSFRKFLKDLADSKDPLTGAQPCVARIQSGDAAGGTGRSGSHKKLVGIYVGWRGLSGKLPGFQQLTFWARKDAAERVAQGSVRELFARLNAVSSKSRAGFIDKPTGKPASRLRTYVIGHSFGASVAYRAMSQSLIDSFSSDLDSAPSNEEIPLTRFVDMVVLVNPAIEAARFEPLFNAARKRAARCAAAPACGEPRYQAPLLAMFTSEGDWATGKLYPIGSTLGGINEWPRSDEQKHAIHRTIGWDYNYVTHRLTFEDCDASSNSNPFGGVGTNLRYKPEGWIWCFKPDSIHGFALKHAPTLEKRTTAQPFYNGPIWNVRVSEDIIASHNDIWNPRFNAVLLQFFADQQSHNLQLAQAHTDAANP